MAQIAVRLLGPAAVADTGEWGRYRLSAMLLGVPGNWHAGGTDEIQRNIIAETWTSAFRENRGARPMLNGDMYRESPCDGRRMFVNGEQIDDVSTHRPLPPSGGQRRCGL
ncbi:MAG: hypothetical protein R2715_08115 [Ilumatobacteraceae bacterium]